MMGYNKYEVDGAVHHKAYEEGLDWYVKIIDFALNHLEGKTVLDVGCGDGCFLKLASERGYEVTGMDENQAGLDLARFFCPKAQLIKTDITEYTKPGNDPAPVLYDTITCINTIEHLDKPQKVMEMFESQCVQKMIIITDVPRSKAKIGRYHFKEYTPDELIESLGIWKYAYKVTTEGLDRFWAVEVWR